MESVALARAVVRQVTQDLTFSQEDIRKIELVIREACKNVLEFAYEDGEEALYWVEGRIEAGRLILRVRDEGLPYDPFHTPLDEPTDPDATGMGIYLMQTFSRELRYVNLGREGKAFDMVFGLPVDPALLEKKPEPQKADLPPVDPAKVEIRRFRPEDAGQVAQCAYRVYGYSYLCDHLYNPDLLIAMNERNQLISVVAADEAGNIVGHIGMKRIPRSTIAEVGQAFVVERARGGGVFKNMKLFLLEEAEQEGFSGVYSDCVTIHTYTQEGNHSLGARESALVLGYIPSAVDYKNIGHIEGERQSVVVFYKALCETEPRRVYAPPQHHEMIGSIYANLGFPADLAEGGNPEPELEQSRIGVRVNNLYRFAFIRVEEYGKDFVERITKRLEKLCLRHFDLILLDLPIAQAPTAHLAAPVEELGFRFSGIIPHRFEDSDALRYQYLNNVDIDPEKIELYSDFAKGLRDYILPQGG